MSRAVFADTDAVVREDVRRRQAHEGSQADHGFHVIAEDEERAGIRTDTAVKGQAIGDGAHSQFTDAEVDVAAAVIGLAEEAFAFHFRLVRRSQVGAAAKELRHDVFQAVDHRAGQAARSLRFIFISPEIFVIQEGLCIDIAVESIPFSFHIREFGSVVGKEFLPIRFSCAGFLAQFSIMSIDFVRDVEGFLRFRPAQVFFHGDDVFFTQRRAMSGSRALFGRAAIADLGLDGNERRMFLVGFGFFDGFADGIEVRAVFDGNRLETEGSHAGLDIFRKGDVRIAFDRDVVAIVEDDEFGKAECPCQGEGFRRDAFHQAAVAAEGEGVVVDDGITRFIENSCQVSFCHGHADSHAQAGAEGACRRFDARRVAVFRMTRCQGAILTELFNVVHGQAVAVEMEQRIQQHRAVASREDKAVAVRPFRVLCVMVHVICPEFVCNGGCAEGQAGMAGVGLLDGVSRQYTNGIYTSRINGAH